MGSQNNDTKRNLESISNSVSGDGRKFVAELKQFLRGFQTLVNEKIDDIGEGGAAQVIGLKLTEEHTTDVNGMPQNNIVVEFDTTNVIEYHQAQIWVKTTDEYRQVGATGGAKYIIEGVTTGVTYTVKVIAVNKGGGTSNFDEAPTATITIQGSVLIPDAPTQFVLTWDKEGALWEWLHEDNGYVDFYELRLDANAGTYSDKLLDRTRDLKSRVNPNVRSGTAYLFVRNIFGAYSSPATHQFSKPVGSKPNKPTLNKVLKGVNIVMDSLPSGYTHYKLIINGDDFTSDNNEFVYFQFSGSIKVKYCFVDDIGDGEYSDEVTAEVQQLVQTGDIAENAITTEKIDVSAIIAEKIAENAITTEKIKENAIVTEKIAENAIVSNLIASNAVTANKIATNAVTSDKIYANAVTTAKIATNAITADKIKAGAITNEKITDKSVSSVKIADGAITVTKIADGAVGTTKIEGGAITTEKIQAGSIIGEHISAGAISADKLYAGNLDLIGELALVGGAVKLDENGLTCQMDDGYTVFDAQGITYFDKYGYSFGQIRKMCIGTAEHGSTIQFNGEWDKVPSVVCVPLELQVGLKEYSQSDVFMVCNATNVTKRGFDVQCYSKLGAGSISTSPVDVTLELTGSDGDAIVYSFGDLNQASPTEIKINISATTHSFAYGPYGKDDRNYSQWAFTCGVNLYNDGTLVSSIEELATPAYPSGDTDGSVVQNDLLVQTTIGAKLQYVGELKLEFTLKVLGSNYWESSSLTPNIPIFISTLGYTTEDEVVISTGTALFIATTNSSAGYIVNNGGATYGLRNQVRQG